MNRSVGISGVYQGKITLVFVVLAAILVGFMVVYWLGWLEPRLRAEAADHALALSQSQAQSLAAALGHSDREGKADRLSKAMDRVLLFKAPNSEIPFVRKISLEVDYDAVDAEPGSLDLTRGSPETPHCFVSDIALYSPTTRELLGIAHFYNYGKFFRRLKNEVRVRIFLASGLVIILLTLVWLTVSRLIGRLKKYAIDLSVAQEYANNIVESMQDARLVLHTDGTIESVNPYTLDLTGYTEDELLDQPVAKIMANKDFLQGEHLRQFIKSGSIDNTDMDFVHKNGRKISVMFSGASVIDHEGKFSGMIFLAKDIAALKEAERKLQEKQAQMAHTGRLSALGEMATGIAHEINQPLYIIRLAADSLHDYFSRNAPDAIEASDVGKISDQVERASRIIHNMRSFARVDVGSVEVVNLAEPIMLALSFFSGTISEKWN